MAKKYVYKRYKKGSRSVVVSYYVDIHYKNTEGKRTHYTKSFPVKDQRFRDAAKHRAEEHSLQMLHHFTQLGFDLSNAPETVTVGDLFMKIPKHYTLAVNTRKKYYWAFKKYIEPDLAYKDILLVTVEDIKSTLNACAQNCVQKGVNDLLGLWRKIYQVAENCDIPVKNIPNRVSKTKSYKLSRRSALAKNPTNLSEGTFRDFCDYFKEYGHYAPFQVEQIYKREIILYLLKFCRFAGCRPAEAKGIDKNSVTPRTFRFTDSFTNKRLCIDGYEITINKAVGSTENDPLTITPAKNYASNRSIPVVNNNDIALVKEILSFSKNDRLFSDYYGAFFSSYDISDFIGRVKRSYKKKKGKEIDIYAYLLRKSLGSDQRRAGVSPSVTKDAMGHTSEQTAGKYYSSATEEELLNAYYHRSYLNEENYSDESENEDDEDQNS